MSLFSPVERMLAWRYLRARRREGFISLTSWFAVIGIMLGVATLILVTSLMNGIREEMTSQFIGIDGHIGIYSARGGIGDWEKVAELVGGIKGVAEVTPKVEGQVMATARGVALGAQVMAIPGELLPSHKLLASHVTSGSLEAVAGGEGIALGERLARNLQLRVGDTVTLISPQGRSTIAGFIPRMKTYPLVATVKLGVHALDGALVVMPFEEAQIYFKLTRGEEEAAISNLQVSVDELDDTRRVADAIRQKLPNALVQDWEQSNANLFAALKVQRNVMVVILALIILVAAFNIISSLVMLVKEKGGDIAILRTMGATRSTVMKIFMLAGTALGMAGTLLGVGLGLLLAANLEAIHAFVERVTGQQLLIENIYFLSTLPTRTDPREVTVIILLALALSFLATLCPARRAANLDPAEALRYE